MTPAQLSQTLNQNVTPTQKPRCEYDLVIVGGGIIGLTLASALKDSGLRVLLIEAKVESAAVAKGQAYAVHMLSALVYQGIGVWENILPQIATYRRIRLSDADYPDVVEFNTCGFRDTRFGLCSGTPNTIRTAAKVCPRLREYHISMSCGSCKYAVLPRRGSNRYQRGWRNADGSQLVSGSRRWGAIAYP